MGWRRGLILAGIHLAIAVPVVRWAEAGDARALQDRHDRAVEAASQPVPRKHPPNTAVLVRTSVTAPVDPCTTDADYPPQETIARYAELPAFALTGWRLNCPTSWSLSGKLRLPGSLPSSESSLAQQSEIDLYFCVLIGLQWFLIGAFPLTRDGETVVEPATLITVCTVIAFGMVLIPGLSGMAPLPALIASFFWLWWVSLLGWAGIRAGLRLAAKKTQAG